MPLRLPGKWGAVLHNPGLEDPKSTRQPRRGGQIKANVNRRIKKGPNGLAFPEFNQVFLSNRGEIE